MSTVKDFDPILNKDIESFEKKMKAITSNKSKSMDRQKEVKKLLPIKNKIKVGIESYELEISCLKREEAVQYKSSLDAVKNRFKAALSEYEFLKSETTKQDELFNNNNLNQIDLDLAPDQMNQKQLYQVGDDNLDQQDQAIENMLVLGEQCEQMADNINIELDRQIEALDRAQASVYDTNTVLKRTSKQIRYFARALMTDKLIMCLLFSVFLAILVLLVMSAVGLDNGSLNTPDVIKKNSTL